MVIQSVVTPAEFSVGTWYSRPLSLCHITHSGGDMAQINRSLKNKSKYIKGMLLVCGLLWSK
jgi:hypothetical protein